MSANKSNLELDFEQAWNIFAPADAPAYTDEYHFIPSRRFRFDYAFLKERVAVEIDGGQWVRNGGRHNTDKDREKLNLAAVNGWRVLRFSGSMLRSDPKHCIDTILAALNYKGQGK